VIAVVKDVCAVAERAQICQQQGEQTVIFVDEVHRFIKQSKMLFYLTWNQVYSPLSVPQQRKSFL